MNKNAFLAVMIMLAGSFYGCEKKYGDPVLTFRSGAGYVSSDTILMVTDSIRVGLEAAWNGHDMLDRLDIKINEDLVSTYTIDDEAINFDLTLIKGAQETEKWEFIISDKAGNLAEKVLTLTRDPNSKYGGIKYFGSVVLGAQNNINKPGFIGFNPAKTYLLDQAYIKQDSIDILCYYYGTDQTTFSSPGSDVPDQVFAGSKNLTNWSVRNKSNFIKSSLNEAGFLAVTIDAPIIDSWKDVDAKDKASNLKVGDVYLFELHNGRKGLILVKRLVSLEDGEVEFAVKIQE